jgi:hypothetical protein
MRTAVWQLPERSLSLPEMAAISSFDHPKLAGAKIVSIGREDRCPHAESGVPSYLIRTL